VAGHQAIADEDASKGENKDQLAVLAYNMRRIKIAGMQGMLKVIAV
jgi:hypothetical protein